MPPLLNIGLFLQGSSSLGRDIMRGAFLFNQTESSVWVFTAEKQEDLLKEGTAALVQCNAMRNRLFEESNKLLGINVSNASRHSFLPRVINDDIKTGEMAADHFLERGFQNFVFFGNPHFAYSIARCEGYQRQLEKRLGPSRLEFREFNYKEIQGISPRKLKDFVGKSPVGCFCASDAIASQVLPRLKESNMHVPEEVGVLGVDNDEMQNLRSPVPISSVRLNGTRIGFLAAEILYRMAKTGYAPRRETTIPPVGVVVRESSDIIAHGDPVIRKMLQYIDLHYADAIQVEDLVRLTGWARRTVEKKFRAACGHTVLQRIHAVRIDRAKQLLVFTPQSVEEIAAKTGFGESPQLITTFKRHLGITPGAYRKKYGQGLLPQ